MFRRFICWLFDDPPGNEDNSWKALYPSSPSISKPEWDEMAKTSKKRCEAVAQKIGGEVKIYGKWAETEEGRKLYHDFIKSLDAGEDTIVFKKYDSN